MKLCSHCKIEKPDEEFHRRFRKGSIRRQSWCKMCLNEYRANKRYQKAIDRRAREDQALQPDCGLHGLITTHLSINNEGLSTALQIGKAGEHLVCTDLILQGYNAFLADAGLPFDVVVAVGGKLLRVQVKTTTSLWECKKSWGKVYRFGLRHGNLRTNRRLNPHFVALDILTVAYLPVSELSTPEGKLKTMVEFKTRKIDYGGRTYANGSIREARWCKFIEDYWRFPNGI
jgi:hypothetical protein